MPLPNYLYHIFIPKWDWHHWFPYRLSSIVCMDYKNVLFKIHGSICNLALLMRNTSVVFNSTANDPCLWQYLINHAVAQKMRIVNLKAQASVSRYRVLFRITNWIFMATCRTLYVHMLLTGGVSHVTTFNRSLHHTYTQDI